MGICFTELVVVLVIVVILFGPSKLPEIAKALGKGGNKSSQAKTKVSKTVTEDKKDE